MPDDNDILTMIGALEAKRTALDNAIASLRVLAGQGDGEGFEMPTSSRSEGGDIRSDTFHGLSTPEAVKKYLRIRKGPRQAKDIAAVLPQGGFKTKATNLYGNVYTALLRLAEAGEVEKLASGEWGLSEWYRGGGAGRKESKGKKAADTGGTTPDQQDASEKGSDES